MLLSPEPPLQPLPVLFERTFISSDGPSGRRVALSVSLHALGPPDCSGRHPGKVAEPCLEGKSYFQERVLENESCSTEHCRVASLEPRTQLPRTGWVQSHLEPWGSAKAANTSSFKLRGERVHLGGREPTHLSQSRPGTLA